MADDLLEFMRQRYPPGQQKIDLSKTYQIQIKPDGARILADTITWDIVDLNLNLYFIEDSGMQEIIRVGKNWPSLTQLCLEKNSITCEGVKGIAGAKWQKLRKLMLNKNSIKSSGFAQMVKAEWPLLQILQLSNNQIGIRGALLFAQTHWPRLQILNLNYNLITNQGVREFSKREWPQLRYLELSNNKLDGKALHYLSQVSLPQLVSLALNRNEIGRVDRTLSELGCVYFCQLKVNALKYLHIFGNGVTLNGIKLILHSGKLAPNCHLEAIKNYFSHQEIESDLEECQIFCNKF